MFRLATLTVLYAGACPSAAFGSTLTPLLEKHSVACGGEAAIEAVPSIEIDLRISGPGHPAFGVLFTATRAERMRINTYGSRQASWRGIGRPADTRLLAVSSGGRRGSSHRAARCHRFQR